MANKNTESFICDIPGCKINFTSEDTLKWHQKKHKISLKLGLTDKSNESSDQTPTPTRFIRNCEEVGLFQDLQHVNPFDETFKRAIQSKNNNNTTSHQNLAVPDTCDDTLHTPHIFPPVEQNIEKSNSTKESIDDITLVIDGDIPISYNNGIAEIEHATSPKSIKVSNVATINNKLKQFIKDKAQNKFRNSRKDNLDSDEDCVIVPHVNENENASSCQKRLGGLANNSATDKLAKQRIRESNRMAQARARIRKKMSQKRMEFQYKALQAENSKLRTENKSLKDELVQLKTLITKQSKADGSTVNGKQSEATGVEESAAPPLTVSNHENAISPKPVSTAPIDEAKTMKNVTPNLPLILPKTSSTVFVQTPVLQAATQVSSCQLPMLLTSQPQLALTVQNPPIQTLSIQNPTIQTPPIQYYLYKI